MTRLLIPVTVLGCMIACAPHQQWEGITVDDKHNSALVGQFDSLESCQVKMGETQGYSGKGCQEYAPGLTANCKPLIQVTNAKGQQHKFETIPTFLPSRLSADLSNPS